MPASPKNKSAQKPDAADVATVAALEAEAARAEARLAKRNPEALPPRGVIERLGEVEVQELDGSTIKLGSMWDESPAALVFLRHYG